MARGASVLLSSQLTLCPYGRTLARLYKIIRTIKYINPISIAKIATMASCLLVTRPWIMLPFIHKAPIIIWVISSTILIILILRQLIRMSRWSSKLKISINYLWMMNWITDLSNNLNSMMKFTFKIQIIRVINNSNHHWYLLIVQPRLMDKSKKMSRKWHLIKLNIMFCKITRRIPMIK